ncbi:MAG TPA: hypothetical protein VJ124_25815 [Pyrinomonadaceae bacterium]|nr:hypothetical protein [Pyrinomonadaceae bacterium]
MSASHTDAIPDDKQPAAAAVPKRITNAQTVCNEKNEKGKLCNGHLKQLRTAGEPSEIHLRGDDVLFKCQTCGTFYMGPPLGHVRDPGKQRRFVEAELSALLQAAGGTLPVIKKDERGVYVLVEAGGEHGHAAKPAAQKAPAPKPPSAPPETKTPPPTPTPASVAPAPAKPAPHKAGAAPNRQLMKRSTYMGVADTGPSQGESLEQKVARLKALAAAAKERSEAGGGSVSQAETATKVAEPEPVKAAAPVTPVADAVAPVVETAPPKPVAASASTHQNTGKADRTLMKRSTYCGVADTGPVPGETFADKVARLTAVAAAAKQRAEGG